MSEPTLGQPYCCCGHPESRHTTSGCTYEPGCLCMGFAPRTDFDEEVEQYTRRTLGWELDLLEADQRAGRAMRRPL